MLAPSQEIRLEALAKALSWYDAAKAWAEFDPKKKSLLSVKSYKEMDTANALRQRAHDHPSNLQLREDSLHSAVELFESALKDVIKTKSISTVYDKLSKMADKMKRREERVTSKYRKFLDLLIDVIQPTNTSGEILKLRAHDPQMKDAPRQRWISVDVKSVNYSKKHVEQLFQLFKKEGLFSVINLEMPTFAYLAACPYDKESNRFGKVPVETVVKEVVAMYDKVAKYLRDNPEVLRKLVKKSKKKSKSKKRRKK